MESFPAAREREWIGKRELFTTISIKDLPSFCHNLNTFYDYNYK
jgi:hypothetical protein